MPRMSGEVSVLNLTGGAMLMAVKGMPLMVSWEQKPEETVLLSHAAHLLTASVTMISLVLQT